MRVPTYTQQKTSLDVPTVAAPNIPLPNISAASGIVQAQGIQNLGEVIGRIGGQVAQRIQERRDFDNRQQSADLRSDFSQKLNDKLFSTAEETVNIDGKDVTRPVGVLNWKGNDAVGASAEFNRYAQSLVPQYVGQVKDPLFQKEFLNDLTPIFESKRGHVVKHEASEWRTAKEDSFKNGIAQAVKDAAGAQTDEAIRMVVSTGDKASDDLSKFMGVDGAALRTKTRADIVKSAAMTRLEASPDGASALALVDGAKDLLDKESYHEIKKDVATASKSMLAEKEIQDSYRQNANFNKIVEGLIDGSVSSLNARDIAQLGINGDLPKGAAESIQKFVNIRNTTGAIDRQGLDKSVVDHTLAVMQAMGPKDLNKAMVEILGDKGFQDTEEGRSRAIVLLQVAKLLGKDKDSRKVASDSLNTVMAFQDQRGLEKGEGVLEFMKLIKAGAAPQDAAQQAIERVSLREVSSKAKENILRNTVLDSIQDYSHSPFGNNVDYKSNISKAVYQYALKSGAEPQVAAELADKVMAPVGKAKDRVDFLQKLTESIDRNIPTLKFSSTLPKDLESVLRSHQLIQFIAEDKSKEMQRFRIEHPYLDSAMFTVQELGAAGFSLLNGFVAGIPGELMKNSGIELPKAQTFVGESLQGVGGLYGFIKGIPGKAAQLTVGRAFKSESIVNFVEGLSNKGKAAAVAATIAYHAAESGAALGVMSAVNTPESGAFDWKARAEAALSGTGTGIAFGTIGTISSVSHPVLTKAIRMAASSMVTWVPTRLQGASVEEQAFQFALGLYFGRVGIKWSDISEVKKETVALAEKAKDENGKVALNNTVAVLDTLSEKNLKPIDVLQKNQQEVDVKSEEQRNALLNVINPSSGEEPTGGQPAILPKGGPDAQGGGAKVNATGQEEAPVGESAGRVRIRDVGADQETAGSEKKVDAIGRQLVSNRPDPEQPVFTAEDKQRFDEISGMSEQWQGGGKLIRDAEGNVTGRESSTFPEELKNIGLEQKRIQPTLNNIREGKPLTPKQKEVAQLLLNWHKEVRGGGEADFAEIPESRRAEILREASKDEPLSKEDQSWGEEDVVAPPPAAASGLVSGDVALGGKVTGLAKSIEADAISRGLVKDLGDLPTYGERPIMTDIAKRVQDLIHRDPELAKKIAFRQAPEQDGLRAEEVYTGLRVKAMLEGDVGMILELKNSELTKKIGTELGQRVKALDPGYAEDPVSAIREIEQAKFERAKDRGVKNVEAEKKKISAEIKSEIKKSAPKVKDWNDFLDSIKC